MTNQKHTVATDALETLGTTIDENAGRDAIHLAVEPVEAGVKLAVGAHVELRDGKAYATAPGEGVGIVDPFLDDSVKKGQRFWLVVYPRTITSLRHVWTHPAFGDTAAVAPSNRTASEQWMRDWAMAHTSYDYYGDGETVSEDAAYAFAIEAGHNNHIGPYEDARDSINGEWWAHWEAITGCRGDRDTYFSCAC